jgi:hypothetical protein
MFTMKSLSLEDKFYLSTNQSTVFHVCHVLRISDLAFLMKFLIGHNTIELVRFLKTGSGV